MDNRTVNFTTYEAFHLVELLTIPNSFRIFIRSINILFGVSTHSYVVWHIVTGTESGIASRFFNLNLSVCEIGNCLNSLLIILSCLCSGLTVVIRFTQGLCITGRPVFECLICVERYLAVAHPVIFLKYKPLRYRVICSIAAWIFTLGSCLCCMFLLVFQFTIDIYMYFFSVQFLIFLPIQSFCCLAVLRALKQSGPGERGREREEENHMKKRAFYLILITTVSMFITYAPYTLTGFFMSTIQNSQTIRILWSFSFVCFYLAGFVQPVLYLHQAGKLFCFCSL